MKIKSITYGKVIPNRDGTKYSTERVECTVEAEGPRDTAGAMLARAQATVGLALGDVDVDKTLGDLKTLVDAGLIRMEAL